MDLSTEIQILQNNIRDLQSQLASAHIRIAELLNDKSASNEEVVKEKQFIQELTGEIQRVNKETEIKIEKTMKAVPQMLDSRPTKPKLSNPNEKYVSVDKDGKMVYLKE